MLFFFTYSYKLATMCHFPAQYEDAYTTLNGFYSPEFLKVDISENSAGGNLAVVMTEQAICSTLSFIVFFHLTFNI